jgi:hypothetical protein
MPALRVSSDTDEAVRGRPVATETRSGRHVSRLALAIAVCIAVGLVPAVAAALTIEIGGSVYKSKCTVCHADINKTEDFAVTFTHGSHITYACSSCHTEFPHRPQGTLTPTMKDCFVCHGLNHGPQGEMATSECYDCHRLGPTTLRPKSHVADWKEKPHVDPSLAKANTECSMCHTLDDCNLCHLREGVNWKPDVPFVYDTQDGCQACHGNPLLTKTSGEGIVKSYLVTGVDESSHRDVTCSQCHTDFTHGDTRPATPLWAVNVGLACQNCHDHEESAAQYAKSVHAEKLAEGDLTSATCASCHGGHDIAKLDTDEAKRALQASAEAMCADCHQDYWDNYNDYYHGAAYKRGAKDAPACWDCHGAHELQPSADASSSVAPVNLAATCSGGECHDQHTGASEAFIRATAKMIHGKQDARAENPLVKLFRSIFGGRS